jgi:F-type H+-transporting ATPase subunit a|tara:strand:+ start:54 stop:977 length:924 start_codon:yes stop_codon:yes gene_type:complete
MNVIGMLMAFQGGRGTAQAGQAEAAPDLSGMIFHHLLDGHELEFEFLGRGWVIHLPEWEPLHIGVLTIDLSPTKHVIFLVLAGVLLTVIFGLVGRAMRNKYTDRAPHGFANAMEAIVLFFRNEVVRKNIGNGADPYTGFILTLFFLILTMNLLGLVPFGATPTGNLAVTGALALATFVVTEITGMRELGLKGYMGTIFYAPPGLGGIGKALMLLIMTPVEFIGKLTKPFALMIRLFANMTAGHTLVLSLLGMIFMFAHLTLGKFLITGASIGFVTAIMVLELFVAFLQAYIFAMLSAVFIGLIRHAH